MTREQTINYLRSSGFSEEQIKDIENGLKEQKTGYWVGTEYDGYADGNPVYTSWKCSNCGAEFECEDMDFEYCPRCGTKMERDERW